jgi:hypothetical protein
MNPLKKSLIFGGLGVLVILGVILLVTGGVPDISISEERGKLQFLPELLGDKVVHPQLGISLLGPRGWSSIEVRNGISFQAVDADKAGEEEFLPGVSVILLDSGLTSLEALARNEKAKASSQPGYELNREMFTITNKGLETYFIDYNFDNSNIVRRLAMVVSVEGKSYLVQAGALAAVHDQKNYRAIFESVLTSFEVQ